MAGITGLLGGFSASTGMLLVSSVALSIMLSNDLIMPALWRFKLLSRHDKHLPKVLKFSRISIVAVMLLGFYSSISLMTLTNFQFSAYWPLVL